MAEPIETETAQALSELREEIKALKRENAKEKGAGRFRGYMLLALASCVLPIALTLASTSYSYTQKVGDTSVVVFATKGWIGDLKDILGILAPFVATGAIGKSVWDRSKSKEPEA